MPTTPEEVLEMNRIIGEYLDPERAEGLFTELYDKVGEKSDNLSVKLSLLMFKVLYTRDFSTIEQRMARLPAIFASYYKEKPTTIKLPDNPHIVIGNLALNAVVVLHFVLLFVLVMAALVLPFAAPWYIGVPLVVYLVNLVLAPNGCLLTKTEDRLRRYLGKPEIKRFVQHYYSIVSATSSKMFKRKESKCR